MAGFPKLGGTFRGDIGVQLYRDYIGAYRVEGLGFPKFRGTFWGVPIVRIIVFRGLYWGPPT